MKKKRLIGVALLLFALQSSSVPAADKVVVVPLGGEKPTGDAIAADVLEGKTFSNKDDTDLSGTMPNIGQQDITPSVSDQPIAQGYHNGSGSVTGDPDLIPENICLGVTIFGVTGSNNCWLTVTSAGQVWMDRNLGALQVATSSTDTYAFGGLYQWGRLPDGHEKRDSAITSTPSTSDVPGHSSFIVPPASPWDWRSPQNDNLWQGVTGINNPCPPGFRLPTDTEWETERLSWSSNNAAGAFASPLKLVVGGYRNTDGTIYDAGSFGFYWSSTVLGTDSRNLNFGGLANMLDHTRAHGFSVRCIKD
jgi:hypothetical protein